jgi:hypothetical protein
MRTFVRQSQTAAWSAERSLMETAAKVDSPPSLSDVVSAKRETMQSQRTASRSASRPPNLRRSNRGSARGRPGILRQVANTSPRPGSLDPGNRSARRKEKQCNHPPPAEACHDAMPRNLLGRCLTAPSTTKHIYCTRISLMLRERWREPTRQRLTRR